MSTCQAVPTVHKYNIVLLRCKHGLQAAKSSEETGAAQSGAAYSTLPGAQLPASYSGEQPNFVLWMHDVAFNRINISSREHMHNLQCCHSSGTVKSCVTA